MHKCKREKKTAEQISSEATSRALSAAAYRSDGLTFREVGEILGVGKARAAQLCNRGESILNGPSFYAINFCAAAIQGINYMHKWYFGAEVDGQ